MSEKRIQWAHNHKSIAMSAVNSKRRSKCTQNHNIRSRSLAINLLKTNHMTKNRKVMFKAKLYRQYK